MLDYRVQLGIHFLGLLCTNLVASELISDPKIRKLIGVVSSTITMWMARYSLNTPPPPKDDANKKGGES